MTVVTFTAEELPVGEARFVPAELNVGVFAITQRPDIVSVSIGADGGTIQLASSPSGSTPGWAWQLLGPSGRMFSVPESEQPIAWKDLPIISQQWADTGCVVIA